MDRAFAETGCRRLKQNFLAEEVHPDAHLNPEDALIDAIDARAAGEEDFWGDDQSWDPTRDLVQQDPEEGLTEEDADEGRDSEEVSETRLLECEHRCWTQAWWSREKQLGTRQRSWRNGGRKPRKHQDYVSVPLALLHPEKAWRMSDLFLDIEDEFADRVDTLWLEENQSALDEIRRVLEELAQEMDRLLEETGDLRQQIAA